MFIYYNVNPEGKKVSDCVIRAISLASGLPYRIIEDKLYYSSKLLECDMFCLNCYSFLLDDYFKYPRINARGMTVREFSQIYKKGVYLVRMKGHISVIWDSNIIDIWDCSNEIITDCWKTKE